MTSVMGRVEEQQETIGFVNSNSDSDSDSDSDSECDVCGDAISGVRSVEDYYCHMQVSGRNRSVILF